MGWFELLRDLGIFGIAAAVIQSILTNNGNRNLEKYKQELDVTIRGYQLTLDSDLERHKGDLSLHLSRQTVLHEKRLLIIDDMYKKLVELDSKMRAMTGVHLVINDGEKEQEERISQAQEAFASYNNYYLFHKLYFNKSTSELLDKIRKEYFSANWDFFEPKRLQSFTGGRPSGQGYREAVDKMLKGSERIKTEIPKILEELEEEFRKMLGVL